MSKKKISLIQYLLGDCILYLLWGLFLSLSYLGIILAGNCLSGFPLMILSVFICYFVLCFIALILPRPKAGCFKLGTMPVYIWYLSLQFGRVWGNPLIRFTIFSNTLMRTTFLKCCGAKISYAHSWSPHATIHDPSLLTLKSGSTIGMHANLIPHAIMNGRLLLGPIKIGKGSLIGGHSLVSFNVEVEDDVIVEGCCVLFPGVKIPDGVQIGKVSHIGKHAEFKTGEKIEGYSRLGISGIKKS